MIFKPIENIARMNPSDLQLTQAKILVTRLARLSADSIWARRASGLRASLDKAVHQMGTGESMEAEHFQYLINLGFEMLKKAAEEIPVPEDILFRGYKNS
jgi:hypothetical protein